MSDCSAAAGGGRGVELIHIVQRLQTLASDQGRSLELRRVDPLSTRGHEDRLERVLGHLVQNALDATPAQGTVWLGVERHSGQVKVEVGDTHVVLFDGDAITREALIYWEHATEKGSKGRYI